MSSPSGSERRRYRTTSAADADLEGIVAESLESWGERQADAYYIAIVAAIRRLGDYPEIGRERDDLFVGCRSHPVEQHLIYYRIARSGILVFRILHKRMKPAGRVTGDIH